MTETLTAPRGRPREYDEAAVTTALMEQFWAHGYDGTSLADIMRVTGLGKASLYAGFGNKQAMYLRALGLYEAREVDGGVAMLGNADIPPDARLRALMHAPADTQEQTTDRRGCFLCNASADRASLDRPTADAVRAGYAKLRAALVALMGELGHGREAAERLGALALTTYSGMRVMARAGVDVAVLRASADAVLDAALPKG